MLRLAVLDSRPLRLMINFACSVLIDSELIDIFSAHWSGKRRSPSTALCKYPQETSCYVYSQFLLCHHTSTVSSVRPSGLMNDVSQRQVGRRFNIQLRLTILLICVMCSTQVLQCTRQRFAPAAMMCHASRRSYLNFRSRIGFVDPISSIERTSGSQSRSGDSYLPNGSIAF